MKVSVYRNLKHGRTSIPLYSVLHKGRVVARKRRVVLRDVVFVVREGGRQRVLKEKRKNVHAFVRGEMVDSAFGVSEAKGGHLPVKVLYNPYVAGYFRTIGGLKIKSALVALLDENGVSVAYVEMEEV